MKKKTYIIIMLVLIISSCKKFLSEVNTDPTQFNSATPAAILQGCIKSTTDLLANNNMNRWWDIAHQVCLSTRYSSDDAGIWQTLYVNVLENIAQIKQQYGNDSGYVNQVQIARIWESYAYYLLVANYGPVAKSQANNPNIQDQIIYDNEDTVYMQILDTLKDAVSKINIANTKDKLDYDVIYNGDVSRWIKFANTLRLEVALNCRRNLGSFADNQIKDVMSDENNTITAENESARVPYENVTNNQNPYFIKFKLNSYAGLPFPSMSEFLFVFFRSYEDPRLGAYFDSVPLRNRYVLTDTLASTQDDSLRVVSYPIPYFGRPQSPALLPGWTALANEPNPLTGLSDTSYSRIKGYGYGAQNDPMPANSLVAAAHPFTVLSYAQSEFLKAEAAQLGLGGGQSAQTYYNAGIAANFSFWGLSSDQLNAYMQQDGIKWDTKGSGFYNYLSIVKADIPQDNLSKIWIQSWLNFFPDQAFESWTLQRRTRVLDLPPLTNPGTSGYISVPYMDIPGRTVYPANSQKLNPVGYADALKKLGVTSIDDLYPYITLHFALPFTVKDWNAVNASYNTAYMQKWYGSTVQDLKAAGVSYTVKSTYLPQ